MHSNLFFWWIGFCVLSRVYGAIPGKVSGKKLPFFFFSPLPPSPQTNWLVVPFFLFSFILDYSLARTHTSTKLIKICYSFVDWFIEFWLFVCLMIMVLIGEWLGAFIYNQQYTHSSRKLKYKFWPWEWFKWGQ